MIQGLCCLPLSSVHSILFVMLSADRLSLPLCTHRCHTDSCPKFPCTGRAHTDEFESQFPRDLQSVLWGLSSIYPPSSSASALIFLWGLPHPCPATESMQWGQESSLPPTPQLQERACDPGRVNQIFYVLATADFFRDGHLS